jgi:toxin-antitoxin system PIN domain toxin
VLLIDVNVLLYAYREGAPGHTEYRRWLEDLVNSEEEFGVADWVLSGFLRIATNPRLFDPPSSLEDALRFAEALRGQPNCQSVAPGPRHWDIFVHLCRSIGAKGNDIPDVYLAALAIESDSDWISTDGGFDRFPDLRWRHPLRSSR